MERGSPDKGKPSPKSFADRLLRIKTAKERYPAEAARGKDLASPKESAPAKPPAPDVERYLSLLAEREKDPKGKGEAVAKIVKFLSEEAYSRLGGKRYEARLMGYIRKLIEKHGGKSSQPTLVRALIGDDAGLNFEATGEKWNFEGEYSVYAFLKSLFEEEEGDAGPLQND